MEKMSRFVYKLAEEIRTIACFCAAALVAIFI
jgi:hypothetical protein